MVHLDYIATVYLHMSRDQETVYAIVEKLENFEIAKTVCESTTHVICGGPRRTVNVLAGTAKGCWILSLEWVRSSVCIKSGSL